MSNEPPPALQRLLDEVPFVRLLARTLLAEEADEIVQRTWLQAVRHGGRGVEQPRSWLGRIVRNVASNLRRDRSRRQRREHDAVAPGCVPSSAELMQREEQRRLLVAAVDRLPAALRAVVLLRFFEGLPPRKIAARLDLPVATVWNQLRRALQLLREGLDAEHGGNRRAWLLPLVPFAAGANGMPWAGPLVPASTVSVSTLGIGVLAMTMKTKLVAAIGVLLAATAVWVLWATRDPVPADPAATVHVAGQPTIATASLPRDAVATATVDAPGQREAVVAPATEVSPTGTLILHVRWGDDHTPAAGVTMLLRRIGGEARFDGLRRTTDASGDVRFESLAPGPVYTISDRSGLRRGVSRIQIEAGKKTETELELEVGITVTGIVVDATGVPVANAMVEVGMPGRADADLEPLATTGADGRFSVRGAPEMCVLGARAAGHASSRLRTIHGKEGNTAEVRLELGPAGGVVDGFVFGPDGAPVENAMVVVGRGRTAGVGMERDGGPPIPALVRTDASGHFHAVGIPAGEQPVQVRAIGHAPWAGQCLVPAAASTSLRVDLTAGAVLRGVVRDAANAPVANADVEIGRWEDFSHQLTRTASDGAFELRGLPPGELEVKARSDAAGRAARRVRVEAGGTATCDLQLSRGIELRIRVLDEKDAPVAEAIVECFANRPSGGDAWFVFARTDAEGRVTAANCPEQGGISVSVRASGFEELRLPDVDPKQSPLELRAVRAAPRSARITGKVVAPDGLPVSNASVNAHRSDRPDQSGMKPTDAEGRFELGPLVPGTWTIIVRASSYPNYTSEPHELAADAVWDLGSVQLVAGGTAVVRVEGDRTDVNFAIVSAAGKGSTGFSESHDALVSGALVPGDYRLLVKGKTVAAQSLPFTVRGGEKSSLTVKLQPGVRQRFELKASASSTPPTDVTLHIHRGTELLVRTWVSLRDDPTGEVCLSPGDYRVSLQVEGRTVASAAFSVGTTEGPPLRLEVR